MADPAIFPVFCACVEKPVNVKKCSIARPVRELKDFRRVTLKAGESAQVEFTLTSDHLAFYGIDGTRRAEPGEFRMWVGPNSAEGLEAQFSIE